MAKNEKKRNRPDLFIIARILEILWSRGGEIKKTKLQLASKLNFNIYIKYIIWLENKELIEISKTKQRNSVIKITVKGVEAHKRILSWIKDFVDEIDDL